MWRILVISFFVITAFYYLTLVLHLLGIIRIGRRLGYRLRWLIPFCLWLERE